MALFGRSKDKSSKSAKSQMPMQAPMYQPVESMRLWGYQLRGAVKIGGDSEYEIYIYDSDAIINVQIGQTIEVEAYCGECTMVSRSGTRWDSATQGDVPILYGNRAIGFARIPKEKIVDAARYGYALRFNAYCRGMLAGYDNVKDMKLIAPRPFYLYEWIKGVHDDRPLSHRENYFMQYVRDGECYRNLIPKARWEFVDVSISMIPTPSDSTAKPHIGVYADDGMQILDISARHAGYKDMLTYMWKYSKYNVIAERMQAYGDEKPAYKVEILGFGEIDHG